MLWFVYVCSNVMLMAKKKRKQVDDAAVFTIFTRRWDTHTVCVQGGDLVLLHNFAFREEKEELSHHLYVEE